MEIFSSLHPHLQNKSPQDILTYALDTWGTTAITLASSLGAEDQVLTHMLTTLTPNPTVFVLDTGRLHNETYEVLHLTMKKYPTLHYEIFAPETIELEALLNEKGPNSFYESVENRKTCCNIRKSRPLKRALAGKKAWITGLRRSQSITRANIPVIEWDETHTLIKLNPLAAWTEEQVWNYLRTHDVPVNQLHKQGYPSIGCAPCTRAIKPGEDIRAGRWWWESPNQKECGLHVKGS